MEVGPTHKIPSGHAKCHLAPLLIEAVVAPPGREGEFPSGIEGIVCAHLRAIERDVAQAVGVVVLLVQPPILVDQSSIDDGRRAGSISVIRIGARRVNRVCLPVQAHGADAHVWVLREHRCGIYLMLEAIRAMLILGVAAQTRETAVLGRAVPEGGHVRRGRSVGIDLVHQCWHQSFLFVLPFISLGTMLQQVCTATAVCRAVVIRIQRVRFQRCAVHLLVPAQPQLDPAQQHDCEEHVHRAVRKTKKKRLTRGVGFL
mmetsp:Transcript_84946/g.216367  ORF Transcript_84946/g.216367 Transcript_84946/m.216367 type:complete len:258 (-) Transcript_84946:12-785(-)